MRGLLNFPVNFSLKIRYDKASCLSWRVRFCSIRLNQGDSYYC